MVISNQKTFGDFFGKVKESARDIIDAEFFLEEWEDILTPEEWHRVSAQPLNEGLVLSLSEDMATRYFERITTICTDDLYYRTVKEGHQFLQIIHKSATEFELDIDISLIDVPLTPTEAIGWNANRQ